MKELDIADLQKKRETIASWHIILQLKKTGRNKLKSKIKETKTAFHQKNLSSKNCKEIWKIVHRILKPNDNTLKVDTNKLNKYFNDTAIRLASRKSMSKKELTSLID